MLCLSAIDCIGHARYHQAHWGVPPGWGQEVTRLGADFCGPRGECLGLSLELYISINININIKSINIFVRIERNFLNLFAGQSNFRIKYS